MIKKLRGVVHGRTVELDADPGIPDGEQVEVEMQVVPAESSGEKKGWWRIAGILADDPEWDQIMEEIYQQRKLERHPKLEGYDE